jgi:hypothetical protein
MRGATTGIPYGRDASGRRRSRHVVWPSTDPSKSEGTSMFWPRPSRAAARFATRIASGAERRGRAARDPLARGVHGPGTADRTACAPGHARGAEARAGHQSDSGAYRTRRSR